jgi:DNA-binding NtrC family response regulator
MKNGVLFISPSVEDAHTLSEMLARIAVPLDHAEDIGRTRQKLEAEGFGALVTEAHLPDGNWLDVIRLVREIRSGAAVVVTDQLADPMFWVDVLEGGAYDLLPKPFSCGEVQRILTNALGEPPQLRKHFLIEE